MTTRTSATENPTQGQAVDGGKVDGVGQCSQHSTEELARDEWSAYDGHRWGLTRAPLCGVISSEAHSEPATSLLLDVVKGERIPFKTGRRRLPRFWTPADKIAIVVPRSPMPVPPADQAAFASYGAEDLAAEARARGKERKKAVDKARSKAAYQFRAAVRALQPGQTCPDCGVELCAWHIFDRRPVFALRDGASVLICRKCNGGKVVSPEAQQAAGVGLRRRPVCAPACVPSPAAIAAECAAIRSNWAPGEAERRRERVAN
jgi:hypothetical protein